MTPTLWAQTHVQMESTVSDFTGRCVSLAQLSTAQTLSWLLCMPAGAVVWPSSACPQVLLTQMLQVLQLCLPLAQALVFLSGTCGLIGEFP